jgi:hypothetical protein
MVTRLGFGMVQSMIGGLAGAEDDTGPHSDFSRQYVWIPDAGAKV